MSKRKSKLKRKAAAVNDEKREADKDRAVLESLRLRAGLEILRRAMIRYGGK